MTAALLLIELQNEWLHPAGKLHGLPQPGMLAAAASGAERALRAARAAGLPVIHAGLRFARGYPELGRAAHGLRAGIPRLGTFPAHEAASEFAPPFVPAAGEFVVQGRIGASAFAGSNLDPYLRNQGLRHLYIAGFALHVCISATAWAAQDLGYEVTILEDAVAAFDPHQQAMVLDHVVHHFGDHITVENFTRAVQR